MANHTPEPWHINKYGDIKANDAERCIPVTGVSIPMAGPRQEEGEANALRIVACVNAFAGIPLDEFEGKDISEFMARQAFLVGAEPSKGGFDLNLQGGACAVLASSFAGQFIGSGATNYLEVNMAHHSIGEFTVTMQRKSGRTPADLRIEAEAQLAAVTAQRDGLLQTLTAIANISHHGALIGKSDIYDAFNEIRRLTIKHWDSAECCRLQSGAIAKCEAQNGN